MSMRKFDIAVFLGKAALLAVLFFLFITAYSADASRLAYVSDKISRSWPGASTSHEIKFSLVNSIPAGGRIIITPAAGQFDIQPGFDFTDIDLTVADNLGGPYADRELAAARSAVEDGVSVVTGANGSITIDLNSSQGINMGKYVQVKLGTIATYGSAGDILIQNPGSIGSYQVTIATFDDFGSPLDAADAMIAVVNPISVSTSQAKIRSNGAPTGILVGGTQQTIMSLNTNYDATCRYSAASNTPYASMAGIFSSTGGKFHSTIIAGLSDGQYYYYYIRCRDTLGVNDPDDYLITFSVANANGGSGGTGGGTGGGIGGIGGGIGGGTGGMGGGIIHINPFLPNLVFLRILIFP